MAAAVVANLATVGLEPFFPCSVCHDFRGGAEVDVEDDEQQPQPRCLVDFVVCDGWSGISGLKRLMSRVRSVVNILWLFNVAFFGCGLGMCSASPLTCS